MSNRYSLYNSHSGVFRHLLTFHFSGRPKIIFGNLNTLILFQQTINTYMGGTSDLVVFKDILGGAMHLLQNGLYLEKGWS